MPFSERGPIGSSDDPITKPQKEWALEAKSFDISPEDQTALRELLRHWEQAKKSNDPKKIDETVNEIGNLIDRPVDDADLFELKEALNEPADDDLFGFEGESDKWDRKTVEETLKPTKISDEKGEENITETMGREKTRHGTNLPLQISSTPGKNLPPKIAKTPEKIKRGSRRGLAQGERQRTDEQKPMWKGRRSQKRKSKLAA